MLDLSSGILVSASFVAATAFTPIVYSTALYLTHLPMLDMVVAPSGRLMVWTDAIRQIIAHPFLVRGIGVNPVLVHYWAPSGNFQTLADAHDIYLGIAAQCGVVGLLAPIALIVHVLLRTAPLRFGADAGKAARLGLGLAFLGSFAYQGIGGSFEDSRHLWLLLGLFTASTRIEATAERER